MNILKKWMADGAEISIKRYSAEDEARGCLGNSGRFSGPELADYSAINGQW